MSKTEKQKMLAGELYRLDAEIAAEQAVTKAWLVRYNAALSSRARPLPAIRPARVTRNRHPKTDGRYPAGFAISPLGCYGKLMFARRSISISGPASA